MFSPDTPFYKKKYSVNHVYVITTVPCAGGIMIQSYLMISHTVSAQPGLSGVCIVIYRLSQNISANAGLGGDTAERIVYARCSCTLYENPARSGRFQASQGVRSNFRTL